jgi:class 3 adenylate cyclase
VVKIGIHSGPSLLVNLNDRSDNFGRTINLASRIKGIAEGGEIVISEALKNDPLCVKRMRGLVKSLSWRTVLFKGIDEAQAVYSLNLAPETIDRLKHLTLR